ncbi:uncharacterized protein LODBEIA_P06710 [Lodderomyces beijingensis]|uniref:Mevalonate kinase n=1 Tax=Lodderomyces beijingensis TaxID=1775926 RepID=A0ABP0ZE68_9ASCO
MTTKSRAFAVNAPGKVILFGEHSAVYGKSAIAAALSLRCYLLVSPSSDANIIRLKFPDIDLDHSWDQREIPWSRIKERQKFDSRGRPQIPSELEPEIVDSLSPLLEGISNNKMHHIACFCFLYLYASLCYNMPEGNTFVVRSTLPIGAGLGSSASTAVCLSAALAKLGNWIADPQLSQTDLEPEGDDEGNDHDLHFINDWSLIGEKCFHGNPSGIDNAVATYGGAVMFQKSSTPGQPASRTNIRNLPPIKLLLTNTKVPKSTAELVAGVGVLNREYPAIVTPILDAMDKIARKAHDTMVTSKFGDHEVAILRKLVHMNHGLLVSLGVSHPSLETVKIVGDKHKLGATKLTGAGGGGCAITLVAPNVEEDQIKEAVREFEEAGFESFETSLGVKGVGMLFATNVKETQAETALSLESFCSYKSRNEIENALAIENVPGWKFW